MEKGMRSMGVGVPERSASYIPFQPLFFAEDTLVAALFSSGLASPSLTPKIIFPTSRTCALPSIR